MKNRKKKKEKKKKKKKKEGRKESVMGNEFVTLRGLFNLRCHHSLKKCTSHLSNLKLVHPLEVFSVGSDAKFKPPVFWNSAQKRNNKKKKNRKKEKPLWF